MSQVSPQTYVLVTGAWHGAFVWTELAKRLRVLGHTVLIPTLTGIGERRHIGNDTADLALHVKDVVAAIEMEDARDLTLVGWSYGGMVIAGVRARLPERVSRMVFLDAFMPSQGKALVDYIPAEFKAGYDSFRDQDQPLPAMTPAQLGLTDPALVSFVEARTVGQPWRTFYQPAQTLEGGDPIPTDFIICTGWGPSVIAARLPELRGNPAIRTTTIDADHYCMLTAVDATLHALTGGAETSIVACVQDGFPL